MIKILEGDSFSFTCSSLGGKPEGTVRQDKEQDLIRFFFLSKNDSFHLIFICFNLYSESHQFKN